MTDRLAMLDLPETHLHALEFLFKRVAMLEFVWALTGSAGLRLQGVDIPVHDLDIQTNQKTIYLIEKELAGFMQTPVHLWESAGMRSLDGKADPRGHPDRASGKYLPPPAGWQLVHVHRFLPGYLGRDACSAYPGFPARGRTRGLPGHGPHRKSCPDPPGHPESREVIDMGMSAPSGRQYA